MWFIGQNLASVLLTDTDMRKYMIHVSQGLNTQTHTHTHHLSSGSLWKGGRVCDEMMRFTPKQSSRAVCHAHTHTHTHSLFLCYSSVCPTCTLAPNAYTHASITHSPNCQIHSNSHRWFQKKKKPQTVSMSQRPMHLHLNPRKDADKTVGFWGGEREKWGRGMKSFRKCRA